MNPYLFSILSWSLSVSVIMTDVVLSMVLILDCIPLVIFGNKKRWNRRIVNGMQHFLGIGRTGRVFDPFRLFHPREWNSWKSRNSWNSCDRFG